MTRLLNVSRVLSLSLLILSGLMSLSPAYAGDKDLLDRILQLDQKFQQLSVEYYRAAPINVGKFQSIEQLNAQFQRTQGLAAIQLLVSNMETIKQNAFSPLLVDFIRALLEHNHLQIANDIRQVLRQADDALNTAHTRLYYAGYYAKQQNWSKVIQTLSDQFNQLADENLAKAYLLQGTALQHLKEHRRALDSYKKIPAESKYAVYAQLNSAIAFIRLGWMTDAQKKIASMLQHLSANTDNELTNRLHVILGYALLQNEYYRDARKSFQRVKPDSQYTSRALLGIALCATNEGDYKGGLKALSVLKKRQTNDLPYEEAFIVIPLLYQKLQQPVSVASTYSEAVDHYLQRITEVEALEKDTQIDRLQLDNQTGDITIDQLRIEYIQQYPASFFRNLTSLQQMEEIPSTKKVDRTVSSLLHEYRQTRIKILRQLLDERKKYLSSYLNQARYGLARHYDNQQREQKQ
jgi:hypothetical protein